jgi:hypothetical protein
MSAGSTHGIGPVSVRYAAQIRELLYTQAVQKAVAEQEAARQQDAAEKAARLQPPADEAPAMKLDAETGTDNKPQSNAADAPAETIAPATMPTPGEIVDIKA